MNSKLFEEFDIAIQQFSNDLDELELNSGKTCTAQNLEDILVGTNVSTFMIMVMAASLKDITALCSFF